MDIASEISCQTRQNRLFAILREIYQNSPFYDHTLWNHVGLVALLASPAATELGGNGPIAYLGGLLHDVGAAKKGPKDHHKTGAEIAGKILNDLNYPKDVIGPVQYCILVHRGSIESERETIEAKCVASADGMAHFYQMPALFAVAFLELKLNSREAGEWIKAKLERDWGKMLPIHQKLMGEKHDIAMEILGEALAW